jgi:malonate transporter
VVNTILASLVPVFSVMVLGYIAGLTRDIDNQNIDSLNALVMDFALPAALFTTMVQTPSSDMIGQAALAAVLVVAMLVTFAMAFAVERYVFAADRRESALLALTASGPNVGSAGLPVIAAVFSRSASVSVAVAVAMAAIVVTPLSLLLLESAGGRRSTPEILRGALLKPIVVAPVAGLLCSLGGIALPSLLDSGLALMGQGASGAALFLTGLVLSAQPVRPSASVGVAAGIKNVLQPLLAGVLAALFLGATEARVAVVLTSIPSGAFGVLFAVRYGVPSARIGTTLIVSTLAGALTLAAAIVVSGMIWA